MQGVKISRVGRIFALATPSYSRGRHNGRSRKTKEARRIMIETFVEKFKASNKGEFPSVTLTVKEVGGSFYTVREILQELKQQNISYDNLRTDVIVAETRNQTTRHTVQPLSLPAESANNGFIDNNHILELKEAKYQETLSDTEEKENLIHNDIMETCGLNDQNQAKQEIKIVERPLGTSAASFVVDPQPLQEVTKGQSISSASNGIIESNHSLEPSWALSDPEEQKNVIHNDVMETCGLHDQTQAKQEIKIVERPLGTSAASVVMDLQMLKGQSISGGSAVVGDKIHNLELKEAEYLEALSDTKEQNNIILNDVMATCGQTQREKEIKIVEIPPETSTVSVVVGVQPVQEVTRGQSISSVSGGFIDNNHSLELNGAKCQETLLYTEEQKNIIHNDVMETCGPNDQSRHETQVKQEIKNIEMPLVTGAASFSVGLQPLQEVTKEQSSEKEVKNQPLSFILDGSQKDKNTHETENLFQISETKDVTNRNVMESCSPYVENVKYEASEVNGKECNPTHKMKSSASISLDACLPELQSSELGSRSLENQNLLGSLEEMEHALPTVSENGSMFGTQKLTSSYNPLEKNSSYIESSEGGEEHFPLDASRPLSLASDSHSTTCVIESPKDVSYSAYHEEDSALAPNSTKRMLEEPASSADKVISSMTDLVTAPGEGNEIPANILEDKKLASSNITPDQVVIGFKAFYGVLLHRLALSALVIQTLVDAADASKKGSSEFWSENLDGYTTSKYCIDLTDKKESASLAASPPLDQGGSIGDMMQTTQKDFADGYRTNNSEKKIGPYQDQGESRGDIMQSSQNNFSYGNRTDILENKNRTYTNTESSKDTEKLETNIILDFFNNIVKGIFYLLKKPRGK